MRSYESLEKELQFAKNFICTNQLYEKYDEVWKKYLIEGMENYKTNEVNSSQKS